VYSSTGCSGRGEPPFTFVSQMFIVSASFRELNAKRVPFFKVGKELRLRVDGKPWTPDDAAV
jgi:hypothetical protein